MARKPRTSRVSVLATGGGNATAGGVSFQAAVAAFLGAEALADAPVDARLSLGAAKATAFRFETEVPVDDILVAMDSGGWVFYQAKNSLTNSASLPSELGKTCLEFARLWEAASAGTGQRGWDRPLSPATDALAIAVGPSTSGTIKHDLARALDLFRSGSPATMNAGQRTVLESFRSLLQAALTSRGAVNAAVDLDAILRLVHVIEYDFGGGHRTAGGRPSRMRDL